MKPESPSPADPTIMVLRPLLALPKEALRRYARKHRLAVREDDSNQQAIFQRNRLRLELLPQLRQSWQPALERVILRTMRLLADEADCLQQQAADWLACPAPQNFKTLHPALQRSIIVRQLLQLGIEPDFECVEFLRTHLGTSTTAEGGVVLQCGPEGNLRVVGRPGPASATPVRHLSLKAYPPHAEFDDLLVSWQFTRGQVQLNPAPGREYLDADRVGDEIVLRHWQAGDRFKPLGMNHSMKIHDWFINRKVPRQTRRQLVLGCTQKGEIFWIEGQQIGHQFRITSRTRRILKWQWERKASNHDRP